jgi:hypothetical protein
MAPRRGLDAFSNLHEQRREPVPCLRIGSSLDATNREGGHLATMDAEQGVVLSDDLANEVCALAYEFNREIETTDDIRSDQLRAAARKLAAIAQLGDGMTTITIQVPNHLAAMLEPLDGKLRLDEYWIGGVIKDAVDQLHIQLDGLSEPDTTARMRSVAAQLEQFAAVLDEIDDQPRRIDAEIDALAGAG